MGTLSIVFFMSYFSTSGLIQGEEYRRRAINNKCQFVRLSTLVVTASAFTVFELEQPDELRGIMLLYTSWAFLVAITRLFVSWFFYQNPAKFPPATSNIIPTLVRSSPLVTVLIPIYNQEELIRKVICAVFESDYQNLEVIAVNDGSTDQTARILYRLHREYPHLRVLNKKNGGKRSAVAKGFYASHGEFIVMIDSDSIIDKKAISEFLKAFDEDPRLGAVTGEVRVWNSATNLLTKCQCAAYDYAFNIIKRSESFFGNVTCCCGCLAAYRREAVANFICHWSKNYEKANEPTSAVEITNSKSPMCSILPYVGQQPKPMRPMIKHIASIANHDDCEDSALTVYSLLKWSTKYISTAIGYTEVPDSLKGYFRQQIRWTKGSLRTQFFASQFMWKRNKFMALIFYTGLVNLFVAPLLTGLISYMAIASYDIWVLLGLGAGGTLFGLLYSIDAKLRYPIARVWRYSIFAYFLTAFIITLTLLPAALHYRKDRWMTR